MTTRRVAQWAINVVDFRDSDAIMTPFEYVTNPFAYGWNVDGNVVTDETQTPGSVQNPTTQQNPGRRVVWGCEYPELLLTETLAFHDRRTADTALDASLKKRTDSPNPDPHLDQPQIPQGSAFFELYCTRSPNNTASADPNNAVARGVVHLQFDQSNMVARLAALRRKARTRRHRAAVPTHSNIRCGVWPSAPAGLRQPT